MSSPAQAMPAPELVDTDAGLARLCEALRSERVVAVDTESNSMHAYVERVCLLQITAAGVDYLVDPLAVDLQPLAGFFADPSCEKIFHAAEYDVMCLRRDYGFEFAALFDTMISARILGWERYGLGSILEASHGLKLNKKMQRYNWGRRPLTQDAIDYARLDTHFLHELRERQLGELDAAGCVDEARAAFDRVAAVVATEKIWDPEGFWGLKGALKLDAQGAAVLAALWRFRDGVARRIDRPVFQVLGNREMIAIAQHKPTTTDALTGPAGVPRPVARRHGRALCALVAEALEAEPPARPPRRPRPKPSPETRRLERLMAWRRAVAEARGVENDVILPKSTLERIAQAGPNDLDALRESGALDAWQLQRYGAELLDQLQT